MTVRSARFAPLVATVATIAVNAAANIVPINGYNTGELSALYPTGFTPAGYVFGIWGLIYLALIGFSLWHAFAGPVAQRRAHGVAWPFVVSCIANSAWIFCWHYRQISASFAMMLLLLASLAVIYLRLQRASATGTTERLAVDLPFSLYFGWVTTATIANLGNLLHDLSWYPLGLAMDEWALVSLVLAVAVYATMLALTLDIVYAAVFIWAAIGIVQQTVDVSAPVQVAAGGGAAVVGALMVLSLVRRVMR